jgi:Dolichyl-phosphate-mannose-protein mannosyltransferase
MTVDVAVEPTATVPRLAWRPVGAVVAVAGIVHLAVATRYGWHRDEFYYVVAGRHPAFGYVDQPPLTPLLARFAADLPGGVLPLRILAIVGQLACVLLAARLAAEFGGGRRAQTLTAAALAACPLFVATSMLFGTTIVDQVGWLAMFVLVARALRVRTTGAWVAVGIVGGVGFENKNTVIVLLAGIAVGLVLWRREVVRTRGPWVAAAVAAVLAAPDVVWNAVHGWPQLRMAHVLSAEQGGPLGSLAQLPLLPLLFASPLLILLWVRGIQWLVAPTGREHRWLLAVAAVAVVVFTASGGKFYYSGPPLAALFAAGAVRVEARANPRGRVAWPVVVGLSAVLAVVTGLPVLPIAEADALVPLNPTLVETYGWPQLTDQVAAVAATLPPGTPILASNYGEAGALDVLGPAAGLRNPVYSGHNAYGDWGPPPGSDDTVLCVGGWTASELRQGWADVTPIAPIRFPVHVHNQEADFPAAMFLCRAPRGTWQQLWPHLRTLS